MPSMIGGGHRDKWSRSRNTPSTVAALLFSLMSSKATVEESNGTHTSNSAVSKDDEDGEEDEEYMPRGGEDEDE